jgi:hypothetical protein
MIEAGERCQRIMGRRRNDRSRREVSEDNGQEEKWSKQERGVRGYWAGGEMIEAGERCQRIMGRRRNDRCRREVSEDNGQEEKLSKQERGVRG